MYWLNTGLNAYYDKCFDGLQIFFVYKLDSKMLSYVFNSYCLFSQ